MEIKEKIKIELEKAILEKDKLENKSWVTCDDKNTKKQWYKVNERIRILKRLLDDSQCKKDEDYPNTHLETRSKAVESNKRHEDCGCGNHADTISTKSAPKELIREVVGFLERRWEDESDAIDCGWKDEFNLCKKLKECLQDTKSAPALSKEDEEKIIDVIKKKVDEATPEELEDALDFLDNYKKDTLNELSPELPEIRNCKDFKLKTEINSKKYKCKFCKDTKYLEIIDGTIINGRCPQCYEDTPKTEINSKNNDFTRENNSPKDKKGCGKDLDYPEMKCGEIEGDIKLCNDCSKPEKSEDWNGYKVKDYRNQEKSIAEDKNG